MPTTSAAWRVDGRWTGLRLGATVLFGVGAVMLRDDPIGLGLCSLAAVGLLGYALRDVWVPVRLAADASGVTVVAGYASRRTLSWQEIERIRVERRTRFGAASEFLEVDAGSDLYLFSGYDLGVAPHEAYSVLVALRAASAAR